MGDKNSVNPTWYTNSQEFISMTYRWVTRILVMSTSDSRHLHYFSQSLMGLSITFKGFIYILTSFSTRSFLYTEEGYSILTETPKSIPFYSESFSFVCITQLRFIGRVNAGSWFCTDLGSRILISMCSFEQETIIVS